MGETEYILIIIVFNFFLLAFIAAAVTFVVQYKNKKRESQAQFIQQEILHQKELLAAEIEIQTQTMQHIGREIHDNVGQKLTLASLYMQQLAFENKAPGANDQIGQVNALIDQSLTELRHLSQSLTDKRIEKENMTGLLQQEVARIEKLKKYQVNLSITTAKELNLAYQTKNVIIRVIQEFLQNSMKHAECKTMDIQLIQQDHLLKIKLQDDGKGFDADHVKNKGIGLINMKKRIELIGGTYLLESHRHKGTTVNIEIALQE